LIEHYGGAFPTWLAPNQVRIIPVGEAFIPYAEKLEQELRNEYVRVDVDAGSESFNKRVRTAVTSKIPNVIVVGEREMQTESVSLRRYGKQEQQVMTFAEFKANILGRIRDRQD
jgi:threonyl-tRNA synthetase